MDDLFTFVGTKKKPAYIVALVERETRRIVAHTVCEERTPDVMQSVIERASPA
jgi:IS1 family transposase